MFSCHINYIKASTALFFEVVPHTGFSLFSIVRTTGEVRLNGSLNYTALGTSYRLKINATVSNNASSYYIYVPLMILVINKHRMFSFTHVS